jgi:uncharacterized protein (TIGR02594 family)
MSKHIYRTLVLLSVCTISFETDARSLQYRQIASLSPDHVEELTDDGRYYFGPPLINREQPKSRRKARAGRIAHQAGRQVASLPALSLGSSGDLVARAERYLGSNPTGRRSLWCSDFVNHVIGRNGTGSSLAKSWLRWGHVSSGRRGDIVVVSRRGGYHVGIVKDFDTKGNPIIISGNSGGKGPGNRTVSVSTYPAGRVVSYRAPG